MVSISTERMRLGLGFPSHKDNLTKTFLCIHYLLIPDILEDKIDIGFGNPGLTKVFLKSKIFSIIIMIILD